MLENFRNLVSVGQQPFKPDKICCLERDRETWVKERETPRDAHPGDKYEEDMEDTPEKEFRFLSHRELPCWKIWEQVAGELTASQDHRAALPGADFWSSEDASLCQGGKLVSAEDSQIGNLVDSLQRDGSINLENHEFPAWPVRPVSFQESWIKASVNETRNVQERWKKLNMEDIIYKCGWDDDGFSWLSHYRDDHGKPGREKPCNCDKGRKDCIKKSILQCPNPGENGFKRNESENGCQEDSDRTT
uniref:Zinc finger protein 229-like n=1 Tax=Camelus bactrianus TaxID=9837 RepID=A0A9W3HCI6_CAMBA